MTPEEAFVDAILADQLDDAARLVFADWLEERGDARGELLRIATELEALERSALPACMAEQLARLHRDAQLRRRWREVIRPEHWPWLAALHRGFIEWARVGDGKCPGGWARLPVKPGRPCERYCHACRKWVRLCWSRREAIRMRGAAGVACFAVVTTTHRESDG